MPNHVHLILTPQLGYGDGVDGAPNGISVPRWSLSPTHLKGSRRLRKSIRNFAAVRRVGLDLAKKVFQVHAVDAKGEVVVARKLARGRLVAFFAELPPCEVAMEACSSAHHWGRQFLALGHEVKLVPPAHVKPYVRRNKNDAADAAAICEAAGRPGQRFVVVRAIDNQAELMRHRARELLAGQRTSLINALRGHLAEVGVVAPQLSSKKTRSRRAPRLTSRDAAGREAPLAIVNC